MGNSRRKLHAGNLETIGNLKDPNQVAIELLKRAEAGELSAVALVVKTTDGGLDELWSDCDMGELSEMALYLHGAVTSILLEEHDALPLAEGPDECEDDS